MEFKQSLIREISQRRDTVLRFLEAEGVVDTQELESHRRFLRLALPLAAALSASAQWQAPAAAHSAPDADFAGQGQQEGSSNPFRFSYARWFSPTLHTYERSFLENYGNSDQQECLLTSNGMAAINLALEAILRRHLKEPILLYVVGQPYGETQDQLQMLAASRRDVHTLKSVRDADELASCLFETASINGIRVVCADCVENGPEMRVFDWRPLLSYTPASSSAGYLILDRTLVGHLWRPLTQRLMENSAGSVAKGDGLKVSRSNLWHR